MCSNQLLQKKLFPWGSHLHWQQNTAGNLCLLDLCRHLQLLLERKPSHLILPQLLLILSSGEGSTLVMLNQKFLILSSYWEKMETFIILFIEFLKWGNPNLVFWGIPVHSDYIKYWIFKINIFQLSIFLFLTGASHSWQVHWQCTLQQMITMDWMLALCFVFIPNPLLLPWQQQVEKFITVLFWNLKNLMILRR